MLTASENLYRLAVESLPDVVSLHNPDGRLVFVSPGLERLCGYTPAEVMGREVLELAHPDDRERLRRALADLRERRREVVVEWRCRTRDGGFRWVAAWSGPLAGPSGSPPRFVSRWTDVTARRQTEESLVAEHRMVQGVLDNTTDAIFVKDRQGRYLLVNPTAARLLGKPPADLLGKTPEDVFDPDTAQAVCARDARVLEQGETQTYEQTLPMAPSRTFLVTKEPLRGPDGEPTALFGIARDITDRKVLEEQLRQTQKMEAVGRLAGGVAHDFNNLLTIISGYGAFLLQQHGPGDPAHEPLREIQQAADRAASLTRQLLAFSQRQLLTPIVLDLNALLRSRAELLRGLLGEPIRLSLELEPHLPRVKLDPMQMEQVLFNLAVNARDAMPKGGTFTLTSDTMTVTEGMPAGADRLPPGTYVRLRAHDTGRGMDESTLGHVFEPFFTTKEVGRGTGLGLSMVYGIIRQCGGHIAAASSPGQGATFLIYLPALPPSDPIPAQAPPATETILLVEDEAAVRGLAREVLRQQGYTVLEAMHGREALQVFDHHAGPVHLLLTDLSMPQMSGAELAREMMERSSTLRVLFMSGFPGTEPLPEGAAQGRPPHFLAKPFRPADLLRAVREALHEPPEEAPATGPDPGL